MPIPFKIDGRKVSCPSSWDEVSVASAIKLKTAKTLSEIFRALTGFGMPVEEFQVRNQIFPFITFVSDPIDFDKIPVPEFILTWDSVYEPLKNLGHGTFGQKIAAQKIISKAFKGNPKTVDVTGFMVELLAVYMTNLRCEQIEQLPFIKAYPVFDHYCNEIVRLVARDKKYLESKPDSELTLAGVEKLSKFGEMRIIDQLAGGDLKGYDAILKMEYDVIFQKLWYVKEQHDLQERLQKIQARKHKVKA